MLKSRFFGSSALLAVAISTAFSSSSAYAQDEAAVEPEIVVTGERVTRSLKETASSVAVFSPDKIDSLATPDTVSGLLQVVPNVTQTGNGNEAPTIRGNNTGGVLSGAEGAFGGARPRSTIQIDGRALTFNEYVFAGTSIWDLQSVEVFRSPQTTTQGRNAISGAIFLKTADPKDEWGAAARGIVGNFATYQGSAYITGPLGNDDTVTIRLAGDYRQQNSYALPVPVAAGGASGADIGVKNLRREYIGTFRSKLRIKASDAIRIDIGYSHSVAGRPQTEELARPFSDRIRINPENSYFKVQSDGVTGAFDFDLGGGFGLVNTTTFTNATGRRLVPAGFGRGVLNTKDLTNETLLNYESDSLKGVAGLYFLDSKGNDSLPLDQFGLFGGRFVDKTRSFGVFGEFTYSPTERLHLTLGGRYQRDKQVRDGGYSFVPGDPLDLDIGIDLTYSAFLPKVGVAYDLNDDVRIGATAQRGYNPGGRTFSFVSFNVENFNEEYVANYEAFIRSRLMGGRLLLNANIFYADFQDAQRVIQETIINNNGTPNDPTDDFPDLNFLFRNAEDARSFGLELDATYKASDKLNFSMALGYNNTKLERYSGTVQTEGNAFGRAPKLTGSATVEFLPIDGLSIGLAGRYSSKYFSEDENLPENKVKSFVVADAQVAYEFSNFRLFASATNLFDKRSPVIFFGDRAIIGDPREISAGVQVKF